MSARAAIEFAVYGGLIPALVALIAFFAAGWLFPAELARRYQAGLAFAVAVFVGCAVQSPYDVQMPSQFWHWIPYLGMLAAFLAGLTRADGVLRGERWTSIYLFAAVAAWLIVPHWPELVPPWPSQLAVFAVALVVVTALLLPLAAGRIDDKWFPLWLAVAAAATSVLVLSEVSETIGKPAALPAGALSGIAVAALLRKSPADWRGLVLPYSAVVGGYAYLGGVYPTTPIWPVVLVPAAPLALWLCTAGPLARSNRLAAFGIQAVCVLTPIVVVFWLVFSRSAGEEAW